ncbi:putative enterotoxin [Ophiocordyceps australis]|uniref:Putative enterotoxin n=1 Tax=Ophiocordyceps australis TaxID=1399860 RepID=A0A2C5XL40_9HYPO|nr:putative enterotoxin [Ophiocordyceps australis]
MKTLWLLLSFLLLLFQTTQGRVLPESESGVKVKRGNTPSWHHENVLSPKSFANFPDPSEVYRADSRSLPQILQTGGFFPRPGEETPGKHSIWSHVKGEIKNTGYVSTTDVLGDRLAFYAKNAQRAPNNANKKAFIYQIENGKNFVDVNKSLRLQNVISNTEHAAIGGIPSSQIKGFVEATPDVLYKLRTGRAKELEWTPNHEYRPLPKKFQGSSIAPELAGWPKEHPAWQEMPWNLILKKNNGQVPDVSPFYHNKVAFLGQNIPGLAKGLEANGLANPNLGSPNLESPRLRSPSLGSQSLGSLSLGSLSVASSSLSSSSPGNPFPERAPVSTRPTRSIWKPWTWRRGGTKGGPSTSSQLPNTSRVQASGSGNNGMAPNRSGKPSVLSRFRNKFRKGRDS